MKKVFFIGEPKIRLLLTLLLLCAGVVIAVNLQRVYKQNKRVYQHLTNHPDARKGPYHPYDPCRILLEKAYTAFKVPKGGVIHVGAHSAEELPVYQKLGIKDVLWVEANPNAEEDLRNRVKHHKGSRVAIFAAASEEGECILHVPHATGLASLLKPTETASKFRPIYMKNIQEVQTQKMPLDHFLASMPDKPSYNVLVIDTQGYEKWVLKGASKTLQQIDAIVVEATFFDMYEGAQTIDVLDDMLRAKGFVRLETLLPTYHIDGDALYVKKRFLAKGSAAPRKRVSIG